MRLNYLIFSAFKLFAINLFALNLFSPLTVQAGWKVDCANHCYFSEMPHNCQGAYYEKDSDHTTYYSNWSDNMNGCTVSDPLTLTIQTIDTSLIQCNCPATSALPPADRSAPMTAATRTQLELLRARIRAWTPCTFHPTVLSANRDIWNPLTFEDLSSCQSMRFERKNSNYITAGRGFPGLLGEVNQSPWDRINYSGDQLSNTDLICQSGELEYCKWIKDAFDDQTGGWYRSPFAKVWPVTNAGQPTFSRDALLGIYGYSIATRDKTRLLKWIQFVSQQPKILGMYNICTPRPNVPKPVHMSQEEWDLTLPDNRCELVPDAAGQLYAVAKGIGVTDSELAAIDSGLYSQMLAGYAVMDASVYVSALSVPVAGGSAYQVADLAEAIFAMLKIGHSNSMISDAARIINRRTSWLNPTYQFLEYGLTATEWGAYMIQKYCKSPAPQYGWWFKAGFNHAANTTGFWNAGTTYHAGGYQYAGGIDHDGNTGQYPVPMGHDCLTWLNMYLQNGTRSEPRCESGHSFINGACLAQSFAKPKFAWVPGIQYQLRVSDLTISYVATHLFQCPYGGVYEANSHPHQCVQPSGLTRAQIPLHLNYWINPSMDAQAIYTSVVGGQCPIGTYEGAQCKVVSFGRPFIHPAVRYWVDPAASPPGVYYQAVSGQCNYGGSLTDSKCLVQAYLPGVLRTDFQYFVRSNPSYPGIFYYPQKIIPERIKYKVSDAIEQISPKLKRISR